MLGVGHLVVIERGPTIGIKSRLIEWSRLEGRNGEYSCIRGDQWRTGGSVIDHGGLPRKGGPPPTADGVQSRSDSIGSSCLGISELDYFQFEAQDLGGCSYSRLVYAGWSARQRRVRKGT